MNTSNCFYVLIKMKGLKRIIKLLFVVISGTVLSLVFTRLYLKHSTLNLIGEQQFQDLVSKIKATPALPQNFKTTYAKVYPGVFENSETKSALSSLFQRKMLPCPGRWIANENWHMFGSSASNFGRKLNYLGFMWLLEEEVSQEQCFEYYLSHFDFLHNTKGPHEAAEFYYHKGLDSLSVDEQLGLILKIQNPAYFDETRHPERCATRIKVIKKQWNEN